MPRPTEPAPRRRRRPTIVTVMALVLLAGGVSGIVRYWRDGVADRRSLELEWEANLTRAVAEIPRIRKERADREAAERAATGRSLREMVATYDRVMARVRAHLAMELMYSGESATTRRQLRELDRMERERSGVLDRLREYSDPPSPR